MKRLTAMVLVLCLLLGLAGCGGSGSGSALQDKLNKVTLPTEPGAEGSEPSETSGGGETSGGKTPGKVGNPGATTPNGPVTGNSDYSAYEGVYIRSDMWEKEDIVLQIYDFGDTLLLEYTIMLGGTAADYWVEEFWPDPDISNDGEYESVTGKRQYFSVAGGGVGSYWWLAETCTLILDGDRVGVWGPNGTEYYTRADSSAGTHTAFADQLANLRAKRAGELTGPVGHWEYDDGYTVVHMYLGADGEFRYVYKAQHKPLLVLEGAWIYDRASGELVCQAEQLGGGKMPYELTLWYSQDGGGLSVCDTSGSGIPPLENGFFLWPAESEEGIGYPMTWMMSTYTEVIGIDGVFIDSNGESEYYSYSVPQLLPASWESDIPLNEEIYNRFGTIADRELERIGNGEPPVYHTVNFSASVYDGLEMVLVWASTYYDEPQCVAYYYDRELGEPVDARSLLNRLNISESYFLETVRAAAEAYFKEAFRDISEEDRAAYGYDTYLAWTVSDEAVNLDMPVVVTDSGEIAVIARIGSIAGREWSYAPLFPFPNITD